MKSLPWLLTLLVCINTVHGQTGANFMIEYQVRFNDAFDRGRKDRLHKGYILIQNNLSRFYMMAVDKITVDNEYDRRFEPDTNLVVFTDQSKGSMIVSEYGFDGKTTFLLDSLYPMQWRISNETKTIDSLTCFKANCTFRGRNYEAWFSPDIPVPFGPWKMGGLPGLIVDLKDDQENMLVRLTRITMSDNHISVPANITYTMAEHIRKMKELMKKLQGSARTAGSGDCISCQSESKYEFFAWEKIPD
jgi:GLPGLI family protein